MQLLGNIIQQIQQRNNGLISEFRKIRKNISIQILLTHSIGVVLMLCFDIFATHNFRRV